MKSTEQLERETEEARTRVAARIDELRARATPGQVIDQVIDYARGSDGGQFIVNLRRQVVANPLPIVLLGTSLAWLVAARSNGGLRAGELRTARVVGRRAGESMGDAMRAARARAEEAGEAGSEALHNMRERAGDVADSASEALDNIRERAGDVADSASETLDNIRERAGDAAVSAKQAIGSIRDRAAETYSSAAGRVRDTAASLGRAAPKLRDGVTSAGQSFVDLCREQPVVLAGIGLAVGATIGALLPQTSAENRVIGAASDDVKARVRRVSAKVSDAAQSVYGEAKHAAGTTMAPRRDAAAEESGSVDLGHS